MSATKKTKTVTVKTAAKPVKEIAKNHKISAKTRSATKGQSTPVQTVKKEEIKVTKDKKSPVAKKAKAVAVKPAIEEKPVATKPAKKAKMVAVKPVTEEKAVATKPAKKAKAVAVKPAVEEKPVEAKPAKKAKLIAVKPVVEEKPVVAKPAKKAKSVAVKPVVEEKPVVAKPAKKAKTVAVKPVVEEKPVEAKPAKKAKTVAVKPVVEEKPVVAKPAKKAKTVAIKPVVEEKPVEAKPAKKAKASAVKPVTEEKPVATKPAKKAKAVAVKTTVEEKPVEAKPAKKAKTITATPEEEKPAEKTTSRRGRKPKKSEGKNATTTPEQTKDAKKSQVPEDFADAESEEDAVAQMAALGDQQEYDLSNVILEEKPAVDRKNAKVAEKHGIIAKNDTMKTYMHEIGQIGLIEKEDEIELAKQIHSEDASIHDNARDTLILSNLRLVVKIAHDFKGLGLPLLDLISEGNIGLMRAVEKFDPSKGAKFSSYAAWWIKQSMRRALANQGRIIRVPVQSAGKITKIKSVRMQLTEKLGREPTKAEIAKKLEYSERTVNSLLLAELKTISLHDPIQQGEDGEFQDIIPDKNAMTPDRILGDEESVKRLMTVLSGLEERERVILTMRFGLGAQKAPMTLEEVSQSIGRTRERVRQIQNQALAKLRLLLADEISFAKE